jgi:hypothetical protein
MIDGVKIHITNINTKEMLNSPFLSFVGSFNANTGEVLNSPMIAQHRGFNIRLVNSTINSSIHCFIDGSIHKFYNKGGENSNDFYYWQLTESLNEIETLFKRHLSEFVIENIEFGVNIKCSTPAKEVIKSIISNGNRRFAEMNVKNIAIGKICTKPGADYELKIYDKGKQAKTKENNLLRIEVKVKKMRFIEDYGIKTLNSLFSREKIGLLGQILANMWAGLVYYDGSIDEKQLSNIELLKLKDFQNPLYWESINRKKRHKERIYFDNLIYKYCPFSQQKEIEKQILTKWKNLVNRKRKNGGHFHQLLQSVGSGKKGTFSQLECMVKSYPRHPKKTNLKTPIKSDNKKRFCPICKTEISEQKTNSKYCSIKCRNKANNQNRQKNIQLQRNKEATQVKSLFSQIAKTNYPLTIFTTANTGTAFEHTDTKTVKPLKYSELRKITAIEIKTENSKYVFTKTHAKEIIKHISRHNQEISK